MKIMESTYPLLYLCRNLPLTNSDHLRGGTWDVGSLTKHILNETCSILCVNLDLSTLEEPLSARDREECYAIS